MYLCHLIHQYCKNFLIVLFFSIGLAQDDFSSPESQNFLLQEQGRKFEAVIKRKFSKKSVSDELCTSDFDGGQIENEIWKTEAFNSKMCQYFEKEQMIKQLYEKNRENSFNFRNSLALNCQKFECGSILRQSLNRKKSKKNVLQFLHQDISFVLGKIEKTACVYKNSSFRFNTTLNLIMERVQLSLNYSKLCDKFLELCVKHPLIVRKRPKEMCPVVASHLHNEFCNLFNSTTRVVKSKRKNFFMKKEMRNADQSNDLSTISPEQWLGNYYSAYFCLQMAFSLLIEQLLLI